MIKMIFVQLWNERKGNLLIWLELLVVSVFLWYAADALFLYYKQYKQSLGFDISHVYYVQLGVVPQESADRDTAAVGGDDFMTVYDRLSHNPRVESVCYTTGTHFHYRGSNQFAYFKKDSATHRGFVRYVDPNYFRVFRVKAADGGPSDPLEQALKEGKIVVTGTTADLMCGNAANARNQEIWITDQGDRDSVSYRIGAVSEPQRYGEFSKYDYAYYKTGGTTDEIRQAGDWANYNMKIFIRVKPAADNSQFVADFRKEMATQLRLGNIYLKEVTPMSDYRDEFIRYSFNQIRLYLACILFFLMNVLLGVIGTFWFRTQQRGGEIGLRMAMGASRQSVFSLLMSEGLLILLIAFVPAILIVINMYYFDVLQSTELAIPLAVRLLVGAGITFGLLLLMIVVGIASPARRAMKVQPAEALRSE